MANFINVGLEKVHSRLTQIGLPTLAYLRYQMICSLPVYLLETFRDLPGPR